MRLFGNRIYNVIRTVMFTALTAAVLVFLNTFAEHLNYFIGALMVFYGAEEMAYAFFNHKKRYNLNTLYWNLVEIVIGGVLMAFVRHPESTQMYTVVCVTWATWSILRESHELVEATEKFKRKFTAIPNILESLTAIAFSVTMIITPTVHHAKIHLYLLAVELITKVLFPILDNVWDVAKEKRIERKKQNETPTEGETAEIALSDEEQTNPPA